MLAREMKGDEIVSLLSSAFGMSTLKAEVNEKLFEQLGCVLKQSVGSVTVCATYLSVVICGETACTYTSVRGSAETAFTAALHLMSALTGQEQPQQGFVTVKQLASGSVHQTRSEQTGPAEDELLELQRILSQRRSELLELLQKTASEYVNLRHPVVGFAVFDDNGEVGVVPVLEYAKGTGATRETWLSTPVNEVFFTPLPEWAAEHLRNFVSSDRTLLLVPDEEGLTLYPARYRVKQSGNRVYINYKVDNVSVRI